MFLRYGCDPARLFFMFLRCASRSAMLISAASDVLFHAAGHMCFTGRLVQRLLDHGVDTSLETTGAGSATSGA